MKKTLLAAAAAIVVIAAPALADVMKMAPMDATMMCRPAMKSEKPGAMMGTMGMTCKKMTAMTMPDITGKTAAQVDKMYRDFIKQALLVPSANPSGGNG